MNHFVTVKTTLNTRNEQICTDIFRDLLHTRHKLYQLASRVAANAGLHAAELNVIDILGKLGPIPMGRLSGETFISPANTTHTVRKLEAAGLVQRQRSEESERSVTVKLTRKGAALFRRCYPTVVASIDGYISDRLSDKDKKQLVNLLGKLAE